MEFTNKKKWKKCKSNKSVRKNLFLKIFFTFLANVSRSKTKKKYTYEMKTLNYSLF